MLVLTIVAVLALLFAVLGMTMNFGEHCQTKFGFKPLAAGTLCLWQLYAILFYGGGCGWRTRLKRTATY